MQLIVTWRMVQQPYVQALVMARIFICPCLSVTISLVWLLRRQVLVCGDGLRDVEPVPRMSLTQMKHAAEVDIDQPN